MNIASVYGIEVPPCGLLPLLDGRIAYLVKRFDRLQDGSKLQQEDFQQLLETDDRYSGSYEKIAGVIKRYSAVPGLDLVRLLERALLFFVLGNGDAHLKNFSLLSREEVGYELSPAYDIVNSRLVLPDEREEMCLSLRGKKNRISRAGPMAAPAISSVGGDCTQAMILQDFINLGSLPPNAPCTPDSPLSFPAENDSLLALALGKGGNYMESRNMGTEIRDKLEIQRIFEELIAGDVEVRVQLEGDTTNYLSRIIHIDAGENASSAVEEPRLTLDKLFPEEGNREIKSHFRIALHFPVEGKWHRCHVLHEKVSRRYPQSGFEISFPLHIEITERRREVRQTYDVPDFVSVEFTVKGGDKIYSLSVQDCSRHGFGVLIGKKDFDLLPLVKPGDRIEGITFYSETSIIKVDGIVRHITQIKTGEHQGSYILGLESPHIIDHSRT